MQGISVPYNSDILLLSEVSPGRLFPRILNSDNSVISTITFTYCLVYSKHFQKCFTCVYSWTLIITLCIGWYHRPHFILEKSDTKRSDLSRVTQRIRDWATLWNATLASEHKSLRWYHVTWTGHGRENIDCGDRWLGFVSWLWHLFAMWPWAACLTPLCFMGYLWRVTLLP